MDFRIWVFLLAHFVMNTIAGPINIENTKHSRRNLQQILQKAAQTAESIGKKALKYVIPDTENTGAAVLKPFLKKRSAKRSVTAQQPQTPYYWPYYNMMSAGPFQRSAIPYPGYMYVNNYNGYWNGNPYWTIPYQRSVIPYVPSYYQPVGSNTETRTLNRNEAAVSKNEASVAKESLKGFQSLISNVDSALVSFSEKSGVGLSENLTGVEIDAKKRGKIEKSKKRSKLTKKKAKNELKVITDTFTDFVCGDSC